ncbi:MAG: ribbon-helix-helix protein, CopG family [Candidatus Bathyarchaeia archaeon]|nr:DUF2379 family protein [Candidatus Bathyarchaeota archaeon]
MPRKCIVKVVLSKEQKEMLEELAQRLGISESETMRMALMDYAKALSLMEERVRRRSLSASSFDSKSIRSIT